MTDPLADLFGGLFGGMGSMIPPKNDDYLPFDAKLANRIRVNSYILLHLKPASS